MQSIAQVQHCIPETFFQTFESQICHSCVGFVQQLKKKIILVKEMRYQVFKTSMVHAP